MTPQPLLPVPPTPLARTYPRPIVTPSGALPSLLSQLDAERQWQLAQHLADLIQRIRLARQVGEGDDHEPV
jgi:hypothetical protein